jgi:hypothetical protein
MAAATSGRRRSRRGAGEHGEARRTRAPGKCGDGFPQLNLDRDRPERGDRRRGGARFSPAAMATGILQVRAREGGEGVAGSLQEDDVVLMVPLIGAGRVCIDGPTRGRAAAEEESSPVLQSDGSGEGKRD